MIFFLSIIPSALVTAGYTYLVLYKDATFKTRAVQTVLRFAISFACYTIFYFASILALGAIYLAFDWYSGSNTAFRIQFVAISLIASCSSIFVATRRFRCESCSQEEAVISRPGWHLRCPPACPGGNVKPPRRTDEGVDAHCRQSALASRASR